MLRLLFKSVHRIFALAAAIILAFPPVYRKYGRTEGLLMSLSLVLFNFVRGIIAMNEWRSKPKQMMVSANQFFQFAEIPILFGVVWGGMTYLPE